MSQPDTTVLAGSAPPQRRTRLPRPERIDRILEVAAGHLGARGYYGLSLQAVADEAGLTLPGMLHYVGTKEGLLQLLIERHYDHYFDPNAFLASAASGSHPDGPAFPAYLRFLVAGNAQRPQLVRLFMVLSAECSSPQHPAHAAFSGRPDTVWRLYSQVNWRLPPQLGGWAQMRDLVELCLQAMDGMQLRSFRSPAIDMSAAWLRFEAVLFPSPLWDGYR